MSCDALILSSLTNAPSANPDTMLGELCTKMGESGGGEGRRCRDYRRFHSNHIEGRRERSHSMLSNRKLSLELIFFLKLIFWGVVIMGVVIIINRVWSMICWSVFIRFLTMLVWWVCPFI